MSDDPISKVYCVGNSKAIIRARWNNLYTFELEYPRFIHSEFMTHRCLTANTVLTNLRDFQSARYMLDHGIDLSAP